MNYEIRQIDAWADECGWTWNESFHLGNFTAKGDDHKRSFLRGLHKLGIKAKRGACVVNYDGDIYELCNRKTGEPLMAAIPTV